MSSQIFTKQKWNIKLLDFGMVYAIWRSLMKRLFDFILASISLILLLPVFLYIAILIKQDSPGPVFFWGWRMGKEGKPFKILKFRTMYERIESYQGPRVTADGDDRITPIGHWLRDTKINELPQLWNVIKGDMSIVGPRPEDIEIAKSWPRDAFDEILSIQPGITSPTSILYHDEEKLLSKESLMTDYFKFILPDKIRLDRLYVRHHSFFSDLDAIFWTIAIIIPQLSETKIPEGYLFAGPISRVVNRYVNWFVIDFIVSILVTYVISLIWTKNGQTQIYLDNLPSTALIIALLFSGFNYLMGLDRVLWSDATIDDALRLTVSVVFMTLMIWMASYFNSVYHWMPTTHLPVYMLLFIGASAGFGFLTTRYRMRLLSSTANRWVRWRKRSSEVGERVLIVGLGEGAKIANYLLRQQTFRTAFSVIGTVDNTNPSQHGMRVSGTWILGGIKDIPSLIQRYDIGVILSTLPQHAPENEYVLEICRTFHAKMIFLDDLLSFADRQITRPQGQTDSLLWGDGHLEYKIMHDAITGLPNRYLLQDRLRHTMAAANRNKTQPVLVFIEFEYLKNAVDYIGNMITTKLIIDLAKRLEKCKRESDTLARFGFDKFALLLDHAPSDREVKIVIQRVETACLEPFNVDKNMIYLNPKIGQCTYNELCDSIEGPNKIEITRSYGYVMSKTNRKEDIHQDG